MKLLFTILFISISISAFTQGAFYKRNLVPYSNAIYSIAEFEEGFILVGNNDANVLTNGYVLLMDKYGEVLWDKIIPAASNDDRYRKVVYKDGFMYIGAIVRVNNSNFCQLIKIDLQGNILFKRIFAYEQVHSSENFITDMLFVDDGILVSGSRMNGANLQGELMKLDFEANIIWQKQFHYDGSLTGISSGIWAIDKKNENYLLNLSTNGSYFSFIQVDELGEEITRSNLDLSIPSSLTEDTLLLKDLMRYREKNTLALYTVLTYQNELEEFYPRVDFALIEYDENGSEISYKRFNNPHGYGSVYLYSNKEDEVFITGTREYGYVLMYKLNLIKLNSDLELAWDRYYEYPYQNSNFQVGEMFNTGMITSDGGFILSGTDLYTYPTSFHYNSSIVKTDCEGNLRWDYKSCSSPKFDEITVFPNPTSDEFTIQIPNIAEKSEVTIRLFDLTGRLMKESGFSNNQVINVNVSELSTGIYSCLVEIDGEILKKFKIMKD
jgi:hypothetical protein